MKYLDLILLFVSGPLFIAAIVGHIYVKIAMRPKDPDFDDYYHEFEDQHPEMQRFEKWSRITFAAAVIAALLLLFVSISI